MKKSVKNEKYIFIKKYPVGNGLYCLTYGKRSLMVGNWVYTMPLGAMLFFDTKHEDNEIVKV